MIFHQLKTNKPILDTLTDLSKYKNKLKLKITKVNSIEAVRLIQDEWNDLHSRCSYRSIYNSFDYLYLACTSVFFPSDELYFLLVRFADSGKLVAIFPFRLTNLYWHRVKFNIIIYAGLNEADKPYPIIDSQFEKESWHIAIKYIKGEKNQWHFLELIEIYEGLLAPQILANEFSSIFYYKKLSCDVKSPIFDLNVSWPAFWSKHRKMRKKVRKIQADFADKMQFRVFNNVDTWNDCLRDYIKLESRSWKADKKIGISRSTKYIDFYRQFFERLAAQNKLFFGFLYIGEQLVSAEIAYSCGDTVYFSHGAFDRTFGKYSPGMVSTSLFLKYFHESSYSKGDFLGGFSHYINPWASCIVPSYNQTIYRVTPKLAVAYVLGIVAKLVLSPIRNIKNRLFAKTKN